MLVIDTDVTRGFVEAIDVLDPTNEHKVLRFVLELLKSVKSLENRLHSKNDEVEELLDTIEKLKEHHEEVTTEDSVYEDEEETNEG